MTATLRRWRGPSGAYTAIAATAARQERAERATIVGRGLFYAVILLIFSRLWQVALERDVLVHASAGDLLWYLAITEWVMLSVPLVHLDIEADLRSGDIAARLPRPVSYLGARLAEAGGAFVMRAAWLAAAGIPLAWLLAGGPPEDVRGLALALPLGLAAGGVYLLFCAAIGLCTVWLQDCSPVYWVWQKAVFVLGGLMIPLELYPAWLRELAWALPFSALLHGPGRMAFGLDFAAAADVALRLLVWGAVAALLLAWVHRRGLRVLDVNGG